MSNRQLWHRTIKRAGLWILISLFIVLIILPILDLPIATSVPAPIWIILVLMDVALIIVLIRLERTARGIIAILLGFAAVAILAVLASQQYATTPPIDIADQEVITER